MKIKLAILESDKSYLNRIVTVFNTKYADKLEIYSFTEYITAMNSLEPMKVDVLLVSEEFTVDSKNLPKRCGMGYFVDTQGMESFRDAPAICKFQKADLIYKQILSIYSEKAAQFTGSGINGGHSKIITFFSAFGGAGGSTLAAACALSKARKGKKTLYLNLETFGAAERYFVGEGQFGFSDVIYALKSQKTNLYLKLESTVKQDVSGVYYYSAANVALDMQELEEKDIRRLLTELRTNCEYDYIIIDSDFKLTTRELALWNETDEMIIVTGGEEEQVGKIERLYRALQVLAQQNDMLRMDKVKLIYNKFSHHTGKVIEGIEQMVLGGVPRFENATVKQIMEQVSGMNIFDGI